MKSNVLIISESHNSQYDVKKILQTKKIKPEFILVEGPFNKKNLEDNFLLEFKIYNSTIKYPSDLFQLIKEPILKTYLNERNIPNSIDIYGLDNINKKIFHESVNELCVRYYKIANREVNTEKIYSLFQEYGKMLEPIHTFLNKVNKNEFSDSELKYIEWQNNSVKGIINQIKSTTPEKINGMCFINSLRNLELFEHQRNSITRTTNYSIFLNSIFEFNREDNNFVIVLNKEHTKVIHNHLSKKGYNVMLHEVE